MHPWQLRRAAALSVAGPGVRQNAQPNVQLPADARASCAEIRDGNIVRYFESTIDYVEHLGSGFTMCLSNH